MAVNEQKIELLVQELMKNFPNQKIVKKLAKELKIPLSSDLMRQTSQVLNIINTLPNEQGFPNIESLS